MNRYAFCKPNVDHKREPLFHLDEIAERLEIPINELRGQMRAHGHAPSPITRNGNDSRWYYRLSEFRDWYDYVKQLPHPRWLPACLEGDAMKPQRIPMSSVRKLNRDHGGHFFERNCLYTSKLPACAVHTPYGNYFVTMDTNAQDLTRYSVRRQDLENGQVESVGEFHSHKAFADARAAMWSAINQAHFAARIPIDEAEDQRELAEALT